MTIMDRPVTFGVIVGTRGFFNPTLAREGRTRLVELIQKLGFE